MEERTAQTASSPQSAGFPLRGIQEVQAAMTTFETNMRNLADSRKLRGDYRPMKTTASYNPDLLCRFLIRSIFSRPNPKCSKIFPSISSLGRGLS